MRGAMVIVLNSQLNFVLAYGGGIQGNRIMVKKRSK